jgi:hypothetical protein
MDAAQVRQLVEQRLQEAQQSKVYKDFGRVSGTAKERRALGLITVTVVEEQERTLEELADLVKKDKVLPKFDPQAEKANGNSAGASYFRYQVLRNWIPKPAVKHRAVFAVYVEALTQFNAVTERDTNLATALQAFHALFANTRYNDGVPTGTMAQRMGDLSNIEGLGISARYEYRGEEAKQYAARTAGMIAVMGKQLASRATNQTFDYYAEALQYEAVDVATSQAKQAKVLKEAEEARVQIRASLKMAQEAKDIDALKASNVRMNLWLDEVVKEGRKDNVNVDVLRKEFTDHFERRLEAIDNGEQAGLERSKPKDEDWTWTVKYFGRAKPVKTIDAGGIQVNVYPNLAELERRNGIVVDRQVTPAQLASNWGLKAVQYGNSLSDGESSRLTYWANASFMDLSDLLRINVLKLNQAMGLGLDLATRGRKGSVATYHPTYKVINLNRQGGDGSLAHEWAHALDHWMGIRRNGEGFLTESTPKEGSATRESERAVAAIMQFIHGTNYTDPVTVKAGDRNYYQFPPIDLDIKPEQFYRDLVRKWSARYRVTRMEQEKMAAQVARAYGVESITVDMDSSGSDQYLGSKKMGKPYWIQRVELFARAFEGYLMDLMDRQNMASDYLQASRKFANKFGVYPSERDLVVLRGLFPELIAALRSEQDATFTLEALPVAWQGEAPSNEPRRESFIEANTAPSAKADQSGEQLADEQEREAQGDEPAQSAQPEVDKVVQGQPRVAESAADLLTWWKAHDNGVQTSQGWAEVYGVGVPSNKQNPVVIGKTGKIYRKYKQSVEILNENDAVQVADRIEADQLALYSASVGEKRTITLLHYAKLTSWNNRPAAVYSSDEVMKYITDADARMVSGWAAEQEAEDRKSIAMIQAIPADGKDVADDVQYWLTKRQLASRGGRFGQRLELTDSGRALLAKYGAEQPEAQPQVAEVVVQSFVPLDDEPGWGADFYDDVRDEVERMGEMTTSDAQGVISAWVLRQRREGKQDYKDQSSASTTARAILGIPTQELAPEPEAQPQVQQVADPADTAPQPGDVGRMALVREAFYSEEAREKLRMLYQGESVKPARTPKLSKFGQQVQLVVHILNAAIEKRLENKPEDGIESTYRWSMGTLAKEPAYFHKLKRMVEAEHVLNFGPYKAHLHRDYPDGRIDVPDYDTQPFNWYTISTFGRTYGIEHLRGEHNTKTRSSTIEAMGWKSGDMQTRMPAKQLVEAIEKARPDYEANSADQAAEVDANVAVKQDQRQRKVKGNKVKPVVDLKDVKASLERMAEKQANPLPFAKLLQREAVLQAKLADGSITKDEADELKLHIYQLYQEGAYQAEPRERYVEGSGADKPEFITEQPAQTEAQRYDAELWKVNDAFNKLYWPADEPEYDEEPELTDEQLQDAEHENLLTYLFTGDKTGAIQMREGDHLPVVGELVVLGMDAVDVRAERIVLARPGASVGVAVFNEQVGKYEYRHLFKTARWDEGVFVNSWEVEERTQWPSLREAVAAVYATGGTMDIFAQELEEVAALPAEEIKARKRPEGKPPSPQQWRKVKAKLKGMARQADGEDMESLRETAQRIQALRGYYGQVDEASRNKRTRPLMKKTLISWAKAPGRMDLEGIDTPR